MVKGKHTSHYIIIALLYAGLLGGFGALFTAYKAKQTTGSTSQATVRTREVAPPTGFAASSVCSPGIKILDHIIEEAAVAIHAEAYNGSGPITDVTNNGLHGNLVNGSNGPTFHLPYNDQKYIWSAGWADETVRTSAANLPSGSDTLVWRWDHDQNRSKMINSLASANTVITIGDDSTGLTGEVRFGHDGYVRWVWSENGSTLSKNAMSTAAFPASGRYRGALRFDPTTGTTTFWTQPLDGNWSAEPGVGSGWTQVGSAVVTGPSTLADTNGDIETGSKEAAITGQTRQYGGSLYRLTVSGSNLSNQIDLHPDRDAEPPYKEFTSETGETWKFRRANPETTSYAITVVDKSMFSIGNASAIRTPASPTTDFGNQTFSDVLVYRTYTTGASPINVLDASANFHNPNVFGRPGFGLAYSSYFGGMAATASDGTNMTYSQAAAPSPGQWHVMVRTVNRETKKMSVWVDGQKVIDSLSIANIGNASWGGALTSGGFADGPGYAGGVMDWGGRLSIGRELSRAEILALQDDLL